MKRLALAISLAVLGTGSAFAADLAPSYTKAPVMASVYNWTGFYVGGNLGYGWGRTSDDVNFLRSAVAFGAVPFSVSADLKGVLGGVQAGYNWQIQRVVFGIEADIDAADIKGSPFQAVLSDFGGPVPGWSHSASQKVDWLGTVRGRVGFTPVDRLLLYVTGGLAYGEVKTSSLTFFSASPMYQYAKGSSTWRAGWTAGVGGEWAFAADWSAKLEYLHYDLGSQDLIALPLAANPPWAVTNHWTTQGDIVRAGINYKFGGGGVAAKY